MLFPSGSFNYIVFGVSLNFAGPLDRSDDWRD